MELDLQSLFWLHVHSCTHWLRPRNPPLHLGSYTSTMALLISQERRHLFVIPWCPLSTELIHFGKTGHCGQTPFIFKQFEKWSGHKKWSMHCPVHCGTEKKSSCYPNYLKWQNVAKHCVSNNVDFITQWTEENVANRTRLFKCSCFFFCDIISTVK